MYKCIYICLLLLSLSLTGCGGGTAATSPIEGDYWGGYEPTDASGDFGKDVAGVSHSVNHENGKALPNDFVTSSADYATFSADPNRVEYMIRVEWGCFFTNIKPDGHLDADGSLITTRGVILTEYGLRFDNGGDAITDRTSVREVLWTARSSVSSDGIIFRIITLPDGSGQTTRVTLSLPGVAYTKVFSLTDLNAYNFTDDPGDNGNLLHVMAFKVDRPEIYDGCALGRWENGKIIGRWCDPYSQFTGKFEGFYETDAQFRKVFYGKIVGTDGSFKGMLKGSWCSSASTVGPEGWFMGVYTDQYLDVTGVVGGHFVEGQADGDGWFRGCWHVGFPVGWSETSMPGVETTGGIVPNP